MMTEFSSVIQLLGMLITDPRTGVLIALLVIAAVSDFKTLRIPNWLTFGGVLFGLIYNTVAPWSPDAGFLWALQGLLVGFLIMLPLYVLKVMGAGDVKLMAMIGAFLGLPDTLYVVLTIFVVGGIAALTFALRKKAWKQMFGNVKNVTQMMMFSAIGGVKPEIQLAASQSVGRMPYGVSMSVGTVCYVVAKQLGYV